MPRLTGRCFCGEIQYEADDEILFRAQCYCRDCQYMSGGHPNFCVCIKEINFKYTQGDPAKFKNPNTPGKVTREFCGKCGTHLTTVNEAAEGMITIKVGTLDDPTLAGTPDLLIFTEDKQIFHHIPENVEISSFKTEQQ